MEKFEKHFKKERIDKIKKPYDLVYDTFIQLGYDKKDKDYFIGNASNVILQLRKSCWENYLEEEKNFSEKMYGFLIKEKNYSEYDSETAVKTFIRDNTDNIYKLLLSNTQSRRSRAGGEFEAIIELLLMGVGVKLDSQGSISSGIFDKYDLGKSVDLVVPGVLEYSKQKRKVSLISCKTTLRERWTEVIEEKDRTGASEVFLACLDNKISSNTLEQLNINNITPVVPSGLKENKYKDEESVITYEEMLSEIIEISDYWKVSRYTSSDLEKRKELLNKQIEYHKQKGHIYVVNFYKSLMENYK